MSSTIAVVPIDLGSNFFFIITPFESNSSLVANFASLCRVIIVNLAAAHRELKASPLNPNVSTLSRSSKSDSFDV